jgi:hypothetical protein
MAHRESVSKNKIEVESPCLKIGSGKCSYLVRSLIRKYKGQDLQNKPEDELKSLIKTHSRQISKSKSPGKQIKE